jgi:translation initiation factor IF-2
MAKKRVSDIAKESGLPPKEVVEKLQKAGLSVKAAGSAVDETEAKKILGVNGGGEGGEAAPKRTVRRVAIDPVVPGRPQGGNGGRQGGGRDAGRGGQGGARGTQAGGRGPQGQGARNPQGQGARGPQSRGPAGPGGNRPGGTQGGPPPQRPARPPSSGTPRGPQIISRAPQPAPGEQPADPRGDRAPKLRQDGQQKRPTRDSLQGERAPATNGPGGRRRVVIDSQAARRGPGGPGGPGGPPPGQRRGKPGGGRRQRRRDFENNEPAPLKTADDPSSETVRIPSGSTVKEVAEHLNVPVPEVIKKLMMMGEMATLTQTLTDDAVGLIATEFEREVEMVSAADQAGGQAEPAFEDADEDLVERPPVVTIMGHVDHGKTSLLDAIRETEVASGEAGGITQHIGAYQVHHNDKSVTFLDTPGHQAFTAMRARGAKVTDIAIVVVAADDGVKPQTEEAIDHAKAAEVPILVAVNKVDKEGADPNRVRGEMAGKGLQPVDWGGDTEFVDVSAKTHQGLDELLETILVMSEVEELRANPQADASGTVIESKLDPGRGPVATVLISRGTLKGGDAIVAGAHWGRVRAMNDFRGDRVSEAGPGMPVEILGWDSVPDAGETVRVVENDRRARQLAQERGERLKREMQARQPRRSVRLEDLVASGAREVNLVIKSDVAGSLEAIEDEIARLPQDEVVVRVISRGVGGINESDVMLAAASDAVVLGFNVRPVGEARLLAEREGVEVRSYSVIYRALEEIRAAMEGMLEPEEVEDSLGHVEVRAIFRASRVGTIAGSYVTDGKVTRGARCRLVRDGTIVYTGEIASLRRHSDDVREVASGFECGIVLKDYADVKEGDEIEVFATRSVERELAATQR